MAMMPGDGLVGILPLRRIPPRSWHQKLPGRDARGRAGPAGAFVQPMVGTSDWSGRGASGSIWAGYGRRGHTYLREHRAGRAPAQSSLVRDSGVPALPAPRPCCYASGATSTTTRKQVFSIL